MAKGTPNDPSMKLNFVAKVWDKVDKTFKPIYIAPDATATVRGDVWLSDAIDGTDGKTEDICTAATGVTAATPKAVKLAYDRIANAKVTITNGDAAVATGTIDSDNNIKVNLTQIDGSTITIGTIPLSVLPHGALDKLYSVPNEEARYKLTINEVQTGDTVQQTDSGELYLVVDDTQLDKPEGYVKYTAGIATQAKALTPGATIQTDLSSEEAELFTGDTNIQPGITGVLDYTHGGTGLDSLGEEGQVLTVQEDEIVWADGVNFIEQDELNTLYENIISPFVPYVVLNLN